MLCRFMSSGENLPSALTVHCPIKIVRDIMKQLTISQSVAESCQVVSLPVLLLIVATLTLCTALAEPGAKIKEG